MLELISSYNLSPTQWGIVILCAALTGMAKTGLSGVGLMVVPLLAAVIGGRSSVGLLLPMLIIADVFAVTWYNRHAEWKHVLRLLPWALAGVLAATLVGKMISDELFKQVLAGIVILGVALMIWQDIRKRIEIPNQWWFSIGLGFLGGFASMIGNAAGPVMSLYLLSMRLPKNRFIGTAAWFFFILNLMKVPFHVFAWGTITRDSLVFDAMMIPAIAAGAFLGIWLVRLFPEKAYRIFILASTLIAALLLF
ncbi:sulfite exporter TauE/SafE family protein [Bacteroidota bacterium]